MLTVVEQYKTSPTLHDLPHMRCLGPLLVKPMSNPYRLVNSYHRNSYRLTPTHAGRIHLGHTGIDAGLWYHRTVCKHLFDQQHIVVAASPHSTACWGAGRVKGPKTQNPNYPIPVLCGLSNDWNSNGRGPLPTADGGRNVVIDGALHDTDNCPLWEGRTESKRGSEVR